MAPIAVKGKVVNHNTVQTNTSIPWKQGQEVLIIPYPPDAKDIAATVS